MSKPAYELDISPFRVGTIIELNALRPGAPKYWIVEGFSMGEEGHTSYRVPGIAVTSVVETGIGLTLVPAVRLQNPDIPANGIEALWTLDLQPNARYFSVVDKQAWFMNGWSVDFPGRARVSLRRACWKDCDADVVSVRNLRPDVSG